MHTFARVILPPPVPCHNRVAHHCGDGSRVTGPVGVRLRSPLQWVFAAAFVVLMGGMPASAQQTLQIEETAATPLDQPDPSQVIATGAALERDRQWSDAIRHYEKAWRAYPNHREIYQRLIISRLHYDVNRRYNDKSFVASAHRLSASQALDLYTEILANLETHYVEPITWSRVLLHGTASLEVALTEDSFLRDALSGVDADRVRQFRETIHRRIADRPSNNRFDLRATVAFVANTASTELGLNSTAVVLEYVGGAVSTLDTYTRLLSGDQLDEMFSNIEGNFVGLGVELKTEEDALRILSVIPGGPAEEAGMLPGERIIRVEHSQTQQSDPNVAADLLRGPEQSYVSLTVENLQGQRRDLNVQRRRVDVPCVENVHLVDSVSRIGYLRLTNFQKTTTRDVERALWDLHRQGMRGLILDLRGNPGGLLSAAVEVADRFMGQGRIVTTRGRNSRENFDYVAHRANTWDVPLAVLIDGDSASASEIFAGAIADSGRGVLVGERSYGKGSVQGIFRMQSAKFGLCLTTAKFYSPSGKAISQNGVDPDLFVQSEYIAARPNDQGRLTLDTEDSVLQKAADTLAARNQMISQRD
ncbi:S41 family peptidase [Roseiconus nitratireducens]|uniref:S41 family peptidase n=1 Tax=Roseiconus nitratireducens TaxID=2605748 RepID=A0A5M6CZH9_9BACT|nr:S41 family peptidase [Roseiconus nitratireducens]KAA5540647.1 S41 family peptidase [Roseiconus nitratireducens]